MSGETFLILGGGGMIGAQVGHEIARQLHPRSVIICSRELSEVEETTDHCRREASASSLPSLFSEGILIASASSLLRKWTGS